LGELLKDYEVVDFVKWGVQWEKDSECVILGATHY
jgi:hypothetical protein